MDKQKLPLNEGKKDTTSVPAVGSFEELYEELSKTIPKDYLVTYNEDGKEFAGYHAQYAIDLLNEVIGLGKWHTVMDIRKEEFIGKGWAVAGMVTILIEYKGKEFAVNGLGGSYAKNIANAYKGFKTSAFKNACRYLGIGKELYVKGFEDDIVEIEEKAEEVIADNDLVKKIESIKSVEQLESLKDSIMAVEGEAVKKVLLKKYNEKMISLRENK